MDTNLKKKFGLLIHLANADGKFDQSEKDLIKTILKEKGLHESYLEEHKDQEVDLDSIKTLSEKGELLFWILKLVQVDGRIDPAEVDYSKKVARQLGYNEDVVEHFLPSHLPSLPAFEIAIQSFKVKAAL